MSTPGDGSSDPTSPDSPSRHPARRPHEPDTAGIPLFPATTEQAEVPSEADEDLFEHTWSAPRRANLVTAALVAGLAAAAGFAGGVLAQKNHDAGIVASAAAVTSAARSQTGSGFGGRSGGFGAAGAPAGSAGPGGTEAASTGGASSQVPVVVGTVVAVSGTTVKVKNFADAIVTVLVPPTATVTAPGLGRVTVGALVSVSGTRGTDGTVTASSVVSRMSGG